MKNVLILGAGLVARPIIHYLLEKGFSVTVASNTPQRAMELIDNHPKGAAIEWDASDVSTLSDLIENHDLVVSLLPYVFHVGVAVLCIRYRKNMVTTSYVKPEMQALDAEAKQAGILILNEMGLDPGIDHMSAMRIIDRIHEQGGGVLEFYSICGALPAPEAANNPFRYKFSWSPKGVVMAGNNDALYLRHGKQVTVPTESLFKHPFRIDFPGINTLEVYPNRDSLAYQSIYGIPEAQTVYRGTFRYPGWCEILDQFKQLNLISNDKLDMTGISYHDLLQHQLTIAQRQESPSTPMSSLTREALEWLGYYSHDPMHRGLDSTFEVTSDLMIKTMSMEPHERDMVVMQHTFLAAYSDGRKEVIRSRMLDYGIPGEDTAIARTVALPAAIGVEMILKGEISEKGVHIPVIPGIYHPVLNQLEKLGITMNEEYHLPVSENIS